MAIADVKSVAKIHYPESDGKPMGETDAHIAQILDLRFSLGRFFRNDSQVYVAADLLLYYVEGDPKEFVVPDVFVARGVLKRERRVYKLWEEGRAPDVVFEITSASTRREDLLLGPDILKSVWLMRRMFIQMISSPPQGAGMDNSVATEAILTRMERARNNMEFLENLTKDG